MKQATRATRSRLISGKTGDDVKLTQRNEPGTRGILPKTLDQRPYFPSPGSRSALRIFWSRFSASRWIRSPFFGFILTNICTCFVKWLLLSKILIRTLSLQDSLHLAVKAGRLAKVEQLLSQNSDVNQLDEVFLLAYSLTTVEWLHDSACVGLRK